MNNKVLVCSTGEGMTRKALHHLNESRIITGTKEINSTEYNKVNLSRPVIKVICRF